MIESTARSVLGIGVHPVSRQQATNMVISAALDGEPFGVSALAVHGLMIGHDDPQFRYRLNELELVVPDGQPVRWALNWLYGSALPERVMGPELMWDVCREAAQRDLPVFLFGSTPETLGLLSDALVEAFPKLRIAGTQASRFRAATAEEAEVDAQRIAASGAKVVFVGLGCPRQEIWTWENRQAVGGPVLAVGAAFDYHAGLLNRAPRWMSRSGLEWLYRLIQEPRRLWQRYATTNPRYLWHLAGQKLGRSFATDGEIPDSMRPS